MLTMALLTMALLTMALLTMALLTMALLTTAGLRLLPRPEGADPRRAAAGLRALCATRL